jgi:hypothetical protein
MSLRAWLTAGAMALPLPAHAVNAACVFIIECYEADPCAEAAFDLSVTDGSGERGVLLTSIAGEAVGLMSLAPNGATMIYARGQTSQQVLTLGTDGRARYTLHGSDGPAVVSYFGTCEDQ